MCGLKLITFYIFARARFRMARLLIIMMRNVLNFLAATCARTCAIFAVVIIGCAFVSTNCPGQSSDEQQVKSVVSQLFKGMELGDSAMVHRCFMAQITMATVKVNKEGQTVLAKETSIAGFLKAIGTPHPEKLYEETWNVRVSIDDRFAQVWCDYAFYVGNKFSHCGVDAFHLFKDADTWKIFHLADTRRTTACDIPAGITKKHTP
jgi:hypothetical protein